METLFVPSTKQRSSGEGLHNSRAFLCHLHFCHLLLVASSPASHPDTMVTCCCHDEEGERCPGATGIMAFDNRWL